MIVDYFLATAKVPDGKLHVVKATPEPSGSPSVKSLCGINASLYRNTNKRGKRTMIPIAELPKREKEVCESCGQLLRIKMATGEILSSIIPNDFEEQGGKG